MRRRVPGIDERRHDVELDVRPDATAGVHVAVMRRNRGDSKGDRALVLTSSAARDLMRALQAAADEADRRAYQAQRREVESSLEEAVAAVARVIAGPRRRRAVTSSVTPRP